VFQEVRRIPAIVVRKSNYIARDVPEANVSGSGDAAVRRDDM
jgi:hypothetical protein